MLLENLLSGPLVEKLSLPMSLVARVGDLRPRFIPKCRVGRGYRAIARNGHVLLASDRALEELPGSIAHVRLQTWHRSILPSDRPEAYGYLFCVRRCSHPSPCQARYDIQLVAAPAEFDELLLDVGGKRWLQVRLATLRALGVLGG
jgi:hypothetical protein